MFTDGKAFGAEIVAIVKDYVGATILPLRETVEALRGEVATMANMERIPGPPGPAGPGGTDGIGLASAFIDHSGCLVVTMTDGTVGSLGKVVGDVAVKETDNGERFVSPGLADEVAKAIGKLAESPSPAAKNNGSSIINLNMPQPTAKKKIISTRRDEAGNLTADVIEQDA